MFKFVQNKCPVYMNKVFRLAENIIINTRNSYLKLSILFRKTSTGQNGLSNIGPAVWNRIPEILKKTKNWNTFKHRMEHCNLNDYVLAIIKNVILFIKCISTSFFFFQLDSSDSRTTVKIRLCACFVFSLRYYFSSH